MSGETFVRFGASFDGPELVSTGTVRELVEGTEQEHVAAGVIRLGQGHETVVVPNICTKLQMCGMLSRRT